MESTASLFQLRMTFILFLAATVIAACAAAFMFINRGVSLAFVHLVLGYAVLGWLALMVALVLGALAFFALLRLHQYDEMADVRYEVSDASFG